MNTSDSPISDVREDMNVLDSAGEEVGTIAEVQMSDPDAVTPAGQGQNESLVGRIADALRPSGLPDQAQENLARKGYVRIDAKGPFAGSRYAAADEIASVKEQTVALTIPEEKLLR
ncbi:hypothetical protein GCM10023169_14890 [Georgenia halophila]|uniref:PRC-barrel domain-containing protein n=1 Tax=Georgenia halophila TaxID=620889 RepID=A0ABP8L4Z9_9MICO